MPPRKSDVRPSTPVAAEEASPSSAKGSQMHDKTDKKDKDKEKDKDKGKTEDAVTIEDLNLPKSIITRLAKGILPPNTQIQGNAILALSKSATVFISYLASHANENTVAAGKKTILPADVFKALDDTEFSFLKGPLEAEFAKFNAIQTEKRTSYRQKVRASKHGPSGGGGDDTDMADTTMASEASASSTSGPRAKKARVDPSSAAAHDDEDDDEDEEIDAIVNDDDDVVDDDDEDEDGDEETQEDDEEDEEEAAAGEDEADGEGSSDETQDALEERRSREEPDEALEGDESD
ncbi:histone-fold-containing protein [Trichoderma gracile]